MRSCSRSTAKFAALKVPGTLRRGKPKAAGIGARRNDAGKVRMPLAQASAARLVPVDHRDARAFLQEPLHGRRADAARAARDDDTFVGQAFHSA